MWQYLQGVLHSLSILVVLGLLCAIAQKFFPSVPGQKIWRKESKLDLAYWLFTALVTLSAIKIFSALVLTLIALVNPATMAA